jgi:hypothetical protein
MAIPIKETPVLRGKAARKFLKDVAENLKKDHTKEYLRAKQAYDLCKAKGWSFDVDGK